MAAAGGWHSQLGGPTLQTLIGLLAVTGMRIGEAIRLDRGDLDLEHERLVVRNSKFGKARELPLHSTTIEALRDYLDLRAQLHPHVETPALLITATGKRLDRRYADWQFAQLRKRVGLTPRPGCRLARPHDIRHTFAVQTMLDSYRLGGDVQDRLAQLSTYLGHADPAASYWYLSAAPELLALAAARLEDHLTEASRSAPSLPLCKLSSPTDSSPNDTPAHTPSARTATPCGCCSSSPSTASAPQPPSSTSRSSTPT
jgi:integrase/recombinase XerD